MIGKWQKLSERTECVSLIVQLHDYMLNAWYSLVPRLMQPGYEATLGVYDNRLPLASYMW